ncbi:MAG: DUF6273 domain-containing protein [Succinivibrionaceae bacterium]|nr:DUF6273 domain-containing protein [Succinivibrionaceae bacterium]
MTRRGKVLPHNKYRCTSVSACNWWVRSPNYNNANNFCNVNTDGSANNNNSRNSNGLAPDFRSLNSQME